jgi:hypothetical protein
MAFGENTRLLGALDIIGAFSQDCNQAVDAAF